MHLAARMEQIARDDGSFQRAKLVFTESDERCGLTAELDGVKKEGVPLALELDTLEDAQTSAGARAQLKEAIRRGCTVTSSLPTAPPARASTWVMPGAIASTTPV